MNKSVAIALCTCNGERFLREQLDSIFNQTYGDIRVYVCDDRSADETVGILEEYRKNRGLLYRINETRLGVVRNFERAIAMTEGDYVALSDQDDIWLPEKVETLVNGIGDHALVCSDAELIDARGRVFSRSYREFSNLQVTSQTPFESLLFHNFVQGATVMFKRELIHHTLPIPPGVRHHDWWLALVASRLGGVRYLDRTLIKYRVHESSRTEVVNAKSIWQVLMRYLKRDRVASHREMEEQLMQLLDLKENDLFKRDMRMIQEAIDYHRCRLKSRPHLRSFLTALRWRKILYPAMNRKLTALSLLRDLLG